MVRFNTDFVIIVKIIMKLKTKFYYIRDLCHILNISAGSAYNYTTVYANLENHISKNERNIIHTKFIRDVINNNNNNKTEIYL